MLSLAQTRRLVDVCWAALAASGVVLLGLGDAGTSAPLSGLLLAFVAGLFWAAYIVASARVGRVLPGAGGLAVALSVGHRARLPLRASPGPRWCSTVRRCCSGRPPRGAAVQRGVLRAGASPPLCAASPTQVSRDPHEPGAPGRRDRPGLVVLGQELAARGGARAGRRSAPPSRPRHHPPAPTGPAPPPGVADPHRWAPPHPPPTPPQAS